MRLSRFHHTTDMRSYKTHENSPHVVVRCVASFACLLLTLTLFMQPFAVAYAQPSSSTEAPASNPLATHLHVTIDALDLARNRELCLDKDVTVTSKVQSVADLLSKISSSEALYIAYNTDGITSIKHGGFDHTSYTTAQEKGAWQVFVNEVEVNNTGVILREGDRVHLQFSVSQLALEPDRSGDEPRRSDVEPTQPDEPLTPPVPDEERADAPDANAYWPEFGSDRHYESARPLPTTPENSECAWMLEAQTDIKPGKNEYLTKNIGDALEVNHKLYSVSTICTCDSTTYACTPRETLLTVSDIDTGKVINQITLPNGIDYTARMLYHEGLIFIPFMQAQIAAYDVNTLQMVWISPKRTGAAGNEVLSSSLKICDGALITATTSGWGESPGAVFALNPKTGKLLWQQSNPLGYYWSGAAQVDRYAVIAGDDGNLQSLDPQSGLVLGSAALGEKVRSQITLIPHTSDCLVNLYNGTIKRYRVETDGQLTLVAERAYGSYSTSTPKVVGDNVVVFGGEGSPQDRKGYLYIFNLSDLGLVTKVATSYPGVGADGKPTQLSPVSQSTPLVAFNNNQAYLYFTCNNMPGGLMTYRMGDTSVSMIHTPDQPRQNYTTASPILLSNGYVLYHNDSGTRFAVRARQASPTPVDPDPENPDNPTPVNPDNPDPIDPGNPVPDNPHPVNPDTPDPAGPSQPRPIDSPTDNPLTPARPGVPSASSTDAANTLSESESEATLVSSARAQADDKNSGAPAEVAQNGSGTSESSPSEVAQGNLSTPPLQPDQTPIQTKSLLGSYILWGSLAAAGLSLLGLFFILSVGRASR